MECEECEVTMKQVDNRFGASSRNRKEYQCPECGTFRERNRHGRR